MKVISINTFRGEIKIKQCYFIWLTYLAHRKNLEPSMCVLVCVLRVLLLYFPYKLANHCIYISCVCLWIALRVLASHSILTTKSITRQYSSDCASCARNKQKIKHNTQIVYIKWFSSKFYATGYHYIMLIFIRKGKTASAVF